MTINKNILKQESKMDSGVVEVVVDDSSTDSNISSGDSYTTQYEDKVEENPKQYNINIVTKLFNRQLYGRFAKHPKARTEPVYNDIPEHCNRVLSEVLPMWDSNVMQHVFMGFTIDGQYLLSYTWSTEENLQSNEILSFIYYLHVWRYAPGHRITMICKQKIFRHSKPQELLDISFSQWPTDRNKVVAYGINNSVNSTEHYVTIFFLPNSQKCDDCIHSIFDDEIMEQLPCLKHTVTIDFMFSITSPYPVCNPEIQLSYPEHIVINTGHYIHVLNVAYVTPQESNSFPLSTEKSEEKISFPYSSSQFFSDSVSEMSESRSELDFPVSQPNIVEAIIEDFSEYDLEGNECTKPFHELNISCEPLNVTGKSYYNTNHSDSRFKVFQNTFNRDSFLNSISAHSSNQRPQLSTASKPDKPKIDKIIAEKTYEFTEDNEKCEKLSSFRKKRLADKKYEFSEDNSENIIPFQLLRQERRILLRNQNRLIRSPDYFVSPRSQTMRSPRSPMLSPSNRPGQSPSSPRNTYCPSLRLSPGSCRSPISPRESTRKFNVYSPSHIDSDCSDNDSKLVLRQINNVPTSRTMMDFYETRSLCNAGLLIVDGKKIEEKPRWIRRVEKRFCNVDFETASLISDVQSRDEYLCIDLPVVVHTANNNQIDMVPAQISDELIGPHIKITQKTFDSEQFCQRRAEKLCAENRLKFTHCEDYDIKIQHICPLSGDIICTAEIKIGAVKEQQNSVEVSQTYTTSCLFVWNIRTDSYKVIESDGSVSSRLVAARQRNNVYVQSVTLDDIPQVHCKKVRHMMHDIDNSLQVLRDTENYIQISMDKNPHTLYSFIGDYIGSLSEHIYESLSDFSDIE